jgi:hypothetical protein
MQYVVHSLLHAYITSKLLLVLYTKTLDHTNCFQCSGTCPAHSILLGNIRGLKTSETTQEFHFKNIMNKDVRIYVNIHITLYSALTNIDCKGFSNSNLNLFISFIIFYLILSLSYLYYSITLITPEK